MRMLMNGKKVNYLVLNGEKFTSEKAFPKYYKFNKLKVDRFYVLKLDSSNKYVFEAQGQSNWTTGVFEYYTVKLDATKNLVLEIIEENGEQYALTNCFPQYFSSAYDHVGAFWIKVSEAGGMTPVDILGG